MTDQTIQRFIEQVRQASRSKSKVVSLSLLDAQDLANAVAVMLANRVSLQEQILRSMEEKASQIRRVSGGSFGKD